MENDPPCPVCRADKLVAKVKSRIMSRNRHVRLLHSEEIARTAIGTTLKEIRLYTGSGSHGNAIAAWMDKWIAEMENPASMTPVSESRKERSANGCLKWNPKRKISDLPEPPEEVR